jgi:hypothetical protein
MGEHAEPSGNVSLFMPLYNETINKDFIPWDFNASMIEQIYSSDKYTQESIECPMNPPKT